MSAIFIDLCQRLDLFYPKDDNHICQQAPVLISDGQQVLTKHLASFLVPNLTILLEAQLLLAKFVYVVPLSKHHQPADQHP